MDPSVTQAAAFAAQYHHPSPSPSPSKQPPYSAGFFPPPMTNSTPSHPSYSEMIMAAISWENSEGKEGGSSKRAIAKYIDRVYTNLPPTHSALLTHHIKRLKNSGQLVMIKNSYQLPSFAPVPVRSAQPQPQTQPDPIPSPLTKRGPGRPPKSKPESQPQPDEQPVYDSDPVEEPVMNGSSVLGKRGRGRPKKQQRVVVPFVRPVAEVSNGKVVVEEGRRRGRRPASVKAYSPEVVETVKRRAGRPPKKKKAVVANGRVSVPVSVSGRSRGRPKKVRTETEKVEEEEEEEAVVVAPQETGRKRGWPKGKLRGKHGLDGVSVGVGMKRRGRKPKMVVVGKTKLYTRKPGRPRKNLALVKHTDSQAQEKANEELRVKLEEMQSKIRDAVGVLRPHIASDSSPDAMTALQQLEELSNMNVTAAAPPSFTEPSSMDIPTDVIPQPENTFEPESLVPSAPNLSDQPMMSSFNASSLGNGMGMPGASGMHVHDVLNAPPMSWMPSDEA